VDRAGPLEQHRHRCGDIARHDLHLRQLDRVGPDVAQPECHLAVFSRHDLGQKREAAHVNVRLAAVDVIIGELASNLVGYHSPGDPGAYPVDRHEQHSQHEKHDESPSKYPHKG
jgi:hypothetical protein